MGKKKKSASGGRAGVWPGTGAGAGRKRKFLFGGLVVLAAAVGIILWINYRAQNVTQDYTISTARGNIVIAVYPRLMPVTVANFEKLVNMGFYSGLTFHRVENWVIQGGDPKGNGTGGPGWTIPLETNTRILDVRGAVGMARSADPNSAGSQFYILKTDAPWLDGQYAVFGKVTDGMDVVDQLAAGDRMDQVEADGESNPRD